MTITKAEAQALATFVARCPDEFASERWAPIPGYEDTYCISETGRVWSRPRPTTSGGLLKQYPDRNGYPIVHLVQNGVQRRKKVHQLVMLAFVGPRPEGMLVRHVDGSKLPHLAVMAYGTPAENSRDTVEHRAHRGATASECVNGHPFDETNTYRHKRRRYCRACRHEQYLRQRARGSK